MYVCRNLFLARINILSLETVSLYVFKEKKAQDGISSQPVVSDLGSMERGISKQSQLLYKWAMPVMKELRYRL